MNNSRDDLSDRLTFSQRYGYEPLPEPMKLKEISDDLRRELWNEIREILLTYRSNSRYGRIYFSQRGKRFIERVIGKFQRIPESRVNADYEYVMTALENSCLSLEFNRVLELLEAMINDRDVNEDFVERVQELFMSHGAAYWLDTSQRPFWFAPHAGIEQGEAIQQAVKTVVESGIAPGAATHLREAAGYLNAGRYADSISKSILAVESIARMIDPNASGTLGPALKSLETSGKLNHPALKKAFITLYGYTNDEQGIRHALVDKDAANVGLDEAMFMYGACASFASYLINKHQKA